MLYKLTASQENELLHQPETEWGIKLLRQTNKETMHEKNI